PVRGSAGASAPGWAPIGGLAAAMLKRAREGQGHHEATRSVKAHFNYKLVSDYSLDFSMPASSGSSGSRASRWLASPCRTSAPERPNGSHTTSDRLAFGTTHLRQLAGDSPCSSVSRVAIKPPWVTIPTVRPP